VSLIVRRDQRRSNAAAASRPFCIIDYIEDKKRIKWEEKRFLSILNF
jgi:hypothetical protein